MRNCGFSPSTPAWLGLMAVLAAPACATEGFDLPVPDAVVATQHLHYRRMFEEKPFPTATITYHANGYYRIHSEGEDHQGIYVMQGRFDDETYTVRYVSLPSADWGGKTAFHQLTFINEGPSAGFFIQDAITDKGIAIAQQNGRFTTTMRQVTPER